MKKILLAFDGSESAAYAVKQFSYLFPEFCNNEPIMVYGRESDDSIPDEACFEELTTNTFNERTMLKLKGNS